MTRAPRLASRRLVTAVPVMLIVVVGTFLMLELAPGDAVDAYILSAGGGHAQMIKDLRVD